MPTFNGHRNWNHWNVSLWVNNDEGLYSLARWYASGRALGYYGDRRGAAKAMLRALAEEGQTHTPDGAPYSVSSLCGAMRGLS
jgi:hypothetical protein